MAEHVQALDLGVRWEPNAPEAVLLADDAGRAALAQQPHFDDADQRCVVLRFAGVLRAELGLPNDEARHTHRLYERGLRQVLWAGVVHQSSALDSADSSESTRHFVIVSKECVVEVLARSVVVQRVDGTPVEAAATALARSITETTQNGQIRETNL